MSFIKTVFSSLRKQTMPLCGIALGLSAPGYGLWPLAWVALIPVFIWVNRQTSRKTVFWGGFGLGFWFQGVYCAWLFDLHPLTWLGFSDVGSRLTTLASWLLVTIEGGLLCGGLMLAYAALKNFLQRLFVFPVLWVFAFSLLHLTPLALPWGLLEYTQACSPIMRALAGLITASGLTMLLVAHQVFWAERLHRVKAVGAKYWALAGLMPLLVFLGGGLIQMKPEPLPLPMAVIQANLPIEAIRSGRLTLKEIEPAYLQPLRKAKLLAGTLVVLPEEGVVPGTVALNGPIQNEVMLELQKIATQKNIFIAVGVTSVDSWTQFYNSIALISPDYKLIQYYHKRRLVPFGEFTPYGFGAPLQRFLAQFGVSYNAPFSIGKSPQLLQAGTVPIGGLVCFELIDGEPTRGGFAGAYRRQGAKLLINTSNLGWFHQNPLMEAQFLVIGQMRAAENHLPLVIASNTGISAVIAQDGRVLMRTQPFSAQHAQTQIIVWK